MDKHTIDQIKGLLLSSDEAVETAILALYTRQTEDEQSYSTTRHSNGRGFTAFDAKTGSYFARWILSGRHLDGRFLAKARAMTMKYAKQLAEVAEANYSIHIPEDHFVDTSRDCTPPVFTECP